MLRAPCSVPHDSLPASFRAIGSTRGSEHEIRALGDQIRKTGVSYGPDNVYTRYKGLPTSRAMVRKYIRDPTCNAIALRFPRPDGLYRSLEEHPR